jgi:DNA-binding response OmpR family regulator
MAELPEYFISCWENDLMKLLVIEDDLRLAESLRRGLIAEGHTAEFAIDGNDGLWRASQQRFDAIVLDIMLPKRNGYSVCAELRKADVWTPILMLTAKDGEYDIAEALDSGADDYLTKPFSLVVLTARLRAISRRNSSERPVMLQIDDLSLDPASRKCNRNGVNIALTRKEFAILELLFRNRGQVTSKAEIMSHAWDFAHSGDSNVVEVFVSRLRRKIDTAFGAQNLRTIWGVGYELNSSAKTKDSGQEPLTCMS